MDGVQSSSQNGSSGVAATRNFDVSVETEVLQLLNFIRRGPFTPEEKNAYRDTVLDYAAEKEASVLTSLAETLLRQGAVLTNTGTPLASPREEETTPTTSEQTPEQVAAAPEVVPTPDYSAGSFGNTRPAPQFGYQNVSEAALRDEVEEIKNDDTPTLRPPLQATPEISTNSNAPVHIPTAPVAPQDTPSTPKPDADSFPSESVSDAPATTTPQEPTPPDSEKSTASIPVKPPIERIKEIKRRVNDAVGNPVHLIDANNEIGREYMNALLNAMKQVSDGTSEDMQHAMERLESAYDAVMRLLVEQPIGGKINGVEASVTKQVEDQQTVADTTSPQTEIPTTQKPTTAPTPTQPVKTPATPPVAPQTSEVSALHKMPIANLQSEEVTSVPIGSTTGVMSEPASPSPTDIPPVADLQSQTAVTTPPDVQPPPPAPPSIPETPPLSEKSDTPVDSLQDPSPTGVTDQQPRVAANTQTAVSAQPAAPQSLAAQIEAQRKSQDQLTQQNRAKNEIAAASTDPLLAPEVSAGLQQLLSEWKLFKSSGIFGTGPSGFEHPLYQQISAMPMSAVVAGRFEGATPEVRQSISDYMNGWYYEQSVAHEMNETFEHYLRRVVSRILQRQKTSAGQ